VYLNQLEDILDGLNSDTAEKDWSYIGVGPNDGKKDGQFIPILYRKGTYTLLKFTNVWLSETPDRPSKGEERSSLCALPIQPSRSSSILVLKYLNLGWDAPYWNRVLTIGEFKHKKSGRNLVVMNTHLDDQGVVARRKSAEIIVDRTNALLSTGKYDGVLLMGDFNSEPSEDAYGTIQRGEASPFLDIAMTYDVGDMCRQGHQNTFTVSTLLSVS